MYLRTLLFWGCAPFLSWFPEPSRNTSGISVPLFQTLAGLESSSFHGLFMFFFLSRLHLFKHSNLPAMQPFVLVERRKLSLRFSESGCGRASWHFSVVAHFTHFMAINLISWVTRAGRQSDLLCLSGRTTLLSHFSWAQTKFVVFSFYYEEFIYWLLSKMPHRSSANWIEAPQFHKANENIKCPSFHMINLVHCIKAEDIWLTKPAAHGLFMIIFTYFKISSLVWNIVWNSLYVPEAQKHDALYHAAGFTYCRQGCQ